MTNVMMYKIFVTPPSNSEGPAKLLRKSVVYIEGPGSANLVYGHGKVKVKRLYGICTVMSFLVDILIPTASYPPLSH